MAKLNDFAIPGAYYFESKNVFSGSRGDFNYRIVPEDDQLHVTVWHGFICSDKAEIEAEEQFPLSATGISQMLAWLDGEFRK